MTIKAASIDAGTNTFRLLIGSLDERGMLLVETREMVITRLGENLAATGIIGDAAIDRAKAAMKKFAGMIKESGVEHIRAAVTAAARRAQNGADFVETIKQHSGIGLEILPAATEAELTGVGAAEAIGVAVGRMVLIDVGGGSTEFVELTDGKMTGFQSLDTGVVSLHEQTIFSDPPDEDDRRRLQEQIAESLDRLTEVLPAENTRLAANAGVPTSMAAIELKLEKYDPERVNGYKISKQKLNQMVKSFLSLSINERSALPCMDIGRADLILPGAAFLEAAVEKFGVEDLIVSDGGLLEGLAVTLLREKTR